MYRFRIKADSKDITVPALRSLLGFAVVIALLYRNGQHIFISAAVLILLAAALMLVKTLISRYRVNSIVIACVAAFLLFAATHALIFSVLMIGFSIAIQYAYIEPVANFTPAEISLKKTFLQQTYSWADFNNVVIKDSLLTLDFKNNKVLQLEILDDADENAFNLFCTEQLLK